jgi:hypothetical protein
MQRKLISVVIGLVIVLASVGASAGAAQPQCPESVGCQPTGDRLDQPRRTQTARPKLQPRPFTDQQGNNSWRAGRHVMY